MVGRLQSRSPLCFIGQTWIRQPPLPVKGGWGGALGFPHHSPTTLGHTCLSPWTVSSGGGAGGHLLITVTPASSTARLGTG